MSKTKLIIGRPGHLVRFSYAHVHEPKAVNEGDDKKYSVSLIISKDDTKMIAKIKAAIKAATELGKSSKWGGKVPKNLKTPLRDGDEDREDEEAYEDAYFINANSKTKPGLVDKDLDEIMDKEEFYSGCFGRASVNFYPYDTGTSKGIACGLNHLQKIKDGDPLGGVIGSAAEHFADDNDFDDEDEDDI